MDNINPVLQELNNLLESLQNLALLQSMASCVGATAPPHRLSDPVTLGKFPAKCLEEIDHHRLCGSPSVDSLAEAILEADGEKSDEDEGSGVAKAKEARARYMRFWRSITTNKQKPAPPCVLAEIAKINSSAGKTPRGALLFLFEDWLQSNEVWPSA